MVSKILAVISFIIIFDVLAPVAFAEEQVCTPVYGGGVVCGARTEEVHEPVKAGLGDSIVLFGGTLIALSGGVFLISKGRLKKSVYIHYNKGVSRND